MKSIAMALGVDILKTARESERLIKKAFSMEGIAEEDIPRLELLLAKTHELLKPE